MHKRLKVLAGEARTQTLRTNIVLDGAQCDMTEVRRNGNV